MRPDFSHSDPNLKEPNVSGSFYSADPEELSRQVDAFISSALVTVPSQRHIEIVIAPHAGYVYSGAVAGHSFKAVSQKQYRTIVILAPSHYFGFEGVSVWTTGAFKTPLGTIEVDEEFSRRLVDSNDNFYFKPEVFEKEHSLEVELPFLQETFTDFKIVPVIMGQPAFETCESLAAALDELIGQRDDVLIVVSTDMSHYHPDALARAMDERTLEAVGDLHAEEVWKKSHTREMEMCGFVPVTTAMLYAKRRGLTAEILTYANSGDVSGDKDRVVGYASVIFYKNGSRGTPWRAPAVSNIAPLTSDQKKRLLEIARTAVVGYVGKGKVPQIKEADPRLLEREGAFVSIYNQGRLRGCVGQIIGRAPLYQTVRDMTIASATEDSRFLPVSKDELGQMDLEISVLSKPREIRNTDEITLGVHGVIISRGSRLGVFLPQVADETGWSKEEFLSNLCTHKAGLPADCWKDPGTKIEIFSADVFGEK
jgi:hypothetical protein